MASSRTLLTKLLRAEAKERNLASSNGAGLLTKTGRDVKEESSKDGRRTRRLCYSAVLGILIAALPIGMLSLPIESGVIDVVEPLAAVLTLPGIFVNMALRMMLVPSKVHDVDPWITLPANALFYGWLANIVLKAMSRRKSGT